MAQVSLGGIEPALPARRQAEADLGEDLSGLVALPGRQAQGPFEELTSLGQVTGPQRPPAQPRQRIGRLGPEAQLFGHVQSVPVQPSSLRVVSGCGLRCTQPFDGLQLPPPITELTEDRQALLGVVARRGEVAPDHRQLGPGAERRRDSPAVAGRAEACQRPAHHGLGRGRVTEIGGGETVEPFQRGPHDGVVEAGELKRRSWVTVLSGEGGEASSPGGGRDPCGVGPVAGGSKSLIQRPPGLGEPAAQEPVPGQGVDHRERTGGVASSDRGLERGPQVGGLGVQALQPVPLVLAAKVRPGAFGEIGVVAAVPLPDLKGFPGLVQALQAVGRDGLQQPVPVAVRPVRDHDQRAVRQPGYQPRHVQVLLSADRLCGFQGAAICRHRQPAQHQPFRFGEQFPAPVDDGPQGLLPRRSVTVPGDEQPEPVIEPVQELVYAQGPDAGRRQLQGQRDAVESPAQRRDGPGIGLVEAETRHGLSGAPDEQLRGAELSHGAGLRAGRAG